MFCLELMLIDQTLLLLVNELMEKQITLSLDNNLYWFLKVMFTFIIRVDTILKLLHSHPSVLFTLQISKWNLYAKPNVQILLCNFKWQVCKIILLLIHFTLTCDSINFRLVVSWCRTSGLSLVCTVVVHQIANSVHVSHYVTFHIAALLSSYNFEIVCLQIKYVFKFVRLVVEEIMFIVEGIGSFLHSYSPFFLHKLKQVVHVL